MKRRAAPGKPATPAPRPAFMDAQCKNKGAFHDPAAQDRDLRRRRAKVPFARERGRCRLSRS